MDAVNQKSAVCPNCGKQAVESKVIIVRELNAANMQATGPNQIITEQECRQCGWIGAEPSAMET